MDHVVDKIKACIDGELPPAEAAAVRAHCRACGSCARVWAEIEAVERVLAETDSIEASMSIWPEVAARLKRKGLLGNRRTVAWTRRVSPRPLLQPAFALGAAVAVVAGLAIGLVLGPGRMGRDVEDAAVAEYLADGSLLVDEVATTLDEVYLSATYDGE